MKKIKTSFQKVIFRAEKSDKHNHKGQITVILLGQSGSLNAPLIVWDKISGHSEGSFGWYRETRAAKPSEYQEDLKILARIYAPEFKIQVVQKMSAQARAEILSN